MADGSGRAINLVYDWALARMPSGWTGRGVCSSLRAQSASPGGVAERLNAPVLKTGVLSRGPWVRIPPPPPSALFPRPKFFFEAARVLDARGFFHCGVHP